MSDQRYFLRLAAIAATIMFATPAFFIRVQSSVAPTALTQFKPKRSSTEREARLAKAREPEPTTNTPIDPDHTILGCWAPLLLDYSGEILHLYADGTFDMWQFSCLSIYDDYPIHGRYLFDGTEIQLGVEEHLDRLVWNHAWCLLGEYEGETFLVPKPLLHTLDLNNPSLPWRLQYRENEWNDAKHHAFIDAMFKRYNETVPASACYPENVVVVDDGQ